MRYGRKNIAKSLSRREECVNLHRIKHLTYRNEFTERIFLLLLLLLLCTDRAKRDGVRIILTQTKRITNDTLIPLP